MGRKQCTMMLKNKEFTILHVEDDPILATLVRTAFGSFGFRGSMITAGRVDVAIALLDERERNREPVNLILTDMRQEPIIGKRSDSPTTPKEE
jgi:hypothetical protein